MLIVYPGRTITQWSNGEYFGECIVMVDSELTGSVGATNLQDDIAIIGSRLGFIKDEAGSTLSTSLDVTFLSSTQFDETGIISTRTDVDIWRLPVWSAGTVTLAVRPWQTSSDTPGNNLNVKIQLLSPTGAVIAEDSPDNDYGASISQVSAFFYDNVVANH